MINMDFRFLENMEEKWGIKSKFEEKIQKKGISDKYFDENWNNNVKYYAKYIEKSSDNKKETIGKKKYF